MPPEGTRPRAHPVEVELRGLHRRFRDMVAVHNLSLTIGRGEFFTLLGPSGCGKTTTLRMIAGLLQPDVGEILFDGRSVTGTPPWERNIGMVFQNYALWPHMTVFENAAFGLVERKTPRAAISPLVNDALRLVGLEGLGGRLPSQLSGGQQQRVAIARAIVTRPRLVLADEPTGNLDTRTSHDIMLLLSGLRASGITILYVTHEADIAAFAARRLVLRDGVIVTDALQTPTDPHPELGS
jgi:ABC-type Fe3+/spermidine/putrescine transport system ATPase subunit